MRLPSFLPSLFSLLHAIKGVFRAALPLALLSSFSRARLTSKTSHLQETVGAKGWRKATRRETAPKGLPQEGNSTPDHGTLSGREDCPLCPGPSLSSSSPFFDPRGETGTKLLDPCSTTSRSTDIASHRIASHRIASHRIANSSSTKRFSQPSPRSMKTLKTPSPSVIPLSVSFSSAQRGQDVAIEVLTSEMDAKRETEGRRTSRSLTFLVTTRNVINS